MDVLDIVKNWLTDNNYDGLYSEGGECACELLDLQPCGENFSDCHPGIKKTWDKLTEKQREHLEYDCEFYMVKKE